MDIKSERPALASDLQSDQVKALLDLWAERLEAALSEAREESLDDDGVEPLTAFDLVAAVAAFDRAPDDVERPKSLEAARALIQAGGRPLLERAVAAASPSDWIDSGEAYLERLTNLRTPTSWAWAGEDGLVGVALHAYQMLEELDDAELVAAVVEEHAPGAAGALLEGLGDCLEWLQDKHLEVAAGGMGYLRALAGAMRWSFDARTAHLAPSTFKVTQLFDRLEEEIG